jgi:hypothetical protein
MQHVVKKINPSHSRQLPFSGKIRSIRIYVDRVASGEVCSPDTANDPFLDRFLTIRTAWGCSKTIDGFSRGREASKKPSADLGITGVRLPPRHFVKGGIPHGC